MLLTNLANKICPIIRFEITDRIVMHNEPCSCGNSRPWLTLEGRTDDVLTFKNGVRIALLSLYAILKEVHGIERFQLVQHEQDRLELRLVAVDREKFFFEAKQAVEKYLKKNKVSAEVYLTDILPQVNPISGKYKHIIAMAGTKK